MSIQEPQNPEAGVRSHRWFVGPVDQYDRSAAMQFTLLTLLGLREHHSLLDIGCGSLRAGRLFIPYLLPGYYCGLEPERWLVENGLETELGREIARLKQPTFSHDDNFTLTTFERSFDFLIAQSVFSHATMAQIRRCLSQAREVMTPSSLFAATFRRGDFDYTGSEWVYPGCSTYRLETFAGMAEENGLGCAALTWPHSNGQTWVVLGDPRTLSRLPPALRDPAVSTGVAELFAPVFGDRNAIPWETRLSQARNELLEAIPPAAGFVLVDEDQWGIGP
ncbi:MAG: Methyltransferase type 12, partial [Armatimonadetes bacterium]|nr:Methyltransferase type 12 [Armatimonadota bacterium]